MPISNEVIELVPVKKSKLKVIILIVIASVMLALAVTFLVMYIIKPAAEASTLEVKDVVITETTLFDRGETDSSGEKVFYASAGNTYTVYADVVADEGLSTEVNWSLSDNAAVIGQPKTGTENGHSFFTFTINADYNGIDNRVIALTARSTEDANKYKVINFKPVLEKTEHILLDQYSWYTKATALNPSVSSAIIDIERDTINIALPTVGSPTYTVRFRQKGYYNNTTKEYSPISYNGNSSITVKSSSTGVVSVETTVIQTSENRETGRFSFTAVSEGTAKITLKASDSGLEKVLTVNVKSCAELGMIENIYISPTPVTEDFFKQPGLKDSNISEYIQSGTLNLVRSSYDETYSDIFKHIVISPLSLQYANGELKTDWQSRIKIASDTDKRNKDAIEINRTNAIITKKLTTAADCGIVVSEGTTATTMGASCKIGVNVFAGNKEGTVTLKSSNGGDITGSVVATENSEFTLNVKYTFVAPEGTTTSSLSDYISDGFKLEFDDAVDVAWGNTKLVSDREYALDNSMTITQGTGNTAFYGEISFKITFNAEATPQSEYSVKFTKIPDGTLSNNDPEWSKTVNFQFTSDTSYADFAEDSFIASKLNANSHSGYIGSKTVNNNDGAISGTLSLFVQHPGSANPALWFDAKDFITADGTVARSSFRVDDSMFNNSGTTFKSNNYSGDSVWTATYTVKNLDKEVFATFDVVISVYDAYKALSIQDAAQKTIEYSATTVTNISDAKDVIRSTTVRGQTSDYGGAVEVDLAYSASETELYGEWVGSEKHFWLDSTKSELLFKYTRSNGIVPQVDLFAYSYINSVDLSRITVTYSAKDPDPHSVAQDAATSCSKVYVFSRKADGVKLFKNSACTQEISADGNYYNYPVSNGNSVSVYISPYITVDGTPIVVRGTAETNQHTIASYVKAYINVKGNEGSGKAPGRYEDLTFVAPTFDDAQAHNIAFDLICNGVAIPDKQFRVTISNESREIRNIAFTSGGNSITEFEFGKFDESDPYGKNIKMTVSFVDYVEGRHTSFASITITFPEYVKLIVDGAEQTGGEYSYTYDGNIKTSNSFEKELRFELIKETLVAQNGQNTSSALDSWNGTIKAVGGPQIDFTTSTAIKEIKYQKYDWANKAPVDGGVNDFKDGSNPVNVNFVLDGTSETEVNGAVQYLRLRYYTYASEAGYSAWHDTFATSASGNGYYVKGIVYDKSQMTFSAHIAGSSDEYNNTGILSYEFKSDSRILVLKPNFSRLGAGTQSYEFDFADALSGTTYKLKINVTVSFNVFSVEQGASRYNVVTTGNGGNSFAQVSGTYKLNGGAASFAPANASTVNAYLVDADDAVYTSQDVYIDDITSTGFKIYVKNDTRSLEKDLFVVVECDGKKSAKSQLFVSTDAVGIRVKSGSIAVSSGNVATVKVESAQNNFAIAAELYDLGSPTNLIDEEITYELYDDNGAVSYASYVNGNIVFGAGAGTSGTLYFKASCAAKNLSLTVTINYTVDVSADGITFENIPASLYYCGAANYTSFDFDGHVKLSTVLGDPVTGFAIERIALASGGDNAFTVTGTAVRPNKSNGADKFTVSVRYGGKSFTATTSNWMDIKGVSFPDITDGSLNVVNDDSYTVNWSLPSASGFNAALTFVNVDSADKFDITDLGNGSFKITVKRDKLIASDYVAHTFKATLMLTPTAQSGMSGSITLENEFILNFTINYIPKLVLSDGNNELTGNSVSYNVSPDDEFTATLVSPKADATYSLEIDVGSDVVNLSAFDNSGVARITFTGRAYGPVRFRATATLYGRVYNSEWFAFTAVNGGSATAELYVGNTNTVAGSSIVIDYDTTAPTYTYKIDTANIGTTAVSASDVTVIYTGDVTATAVTKDASNGNIYYVTFTVAKPTTLNVGGTILVNGVAFHLASRTVTFTATEPTFTVEADKTELRSGEVAHISASKSNLGSLNISSTVAYAAVGDISSYVTVGADGTVTAKQITTDRNVTVRVTVTVNNGAYSGKVYTYTVDIALKATAVNVTFDYNYDSHTGSIAQTVGTNYSLPVEPVREGYTFEGWYTDAAFTANKKVTSATVYSDATVTRVYAHWVADTYNVTFVSDSGSYNAIEVTYGEAYGSLPTPSKTGYTFDGWYTNAGEKIESTSQVKITADTVLTARFTANSLTLTFNANGGTVNPASKTVKYDDEYGTLPTPTKEGNTFDGWFTQAAGGTQVTDQTVATASTTVYAHWTANVYTVYINYNGYDTTGQPMSKELTHGAVYGLSDLTRTGYEFKGWYTSENFVESSRITESTQCIANGTVYAKWTAETFTVRFNVNGGNGSYNAITVTFGQTYGQNGQLPTPTRNSTGNWWNQTTYTFAGWYTEASGDSVRITSDSIVDRMPESGNTLTLYARWTSTSGDQSYVVAFNGNGGTVSSNGNYIRVRAGGTIGSDMPNDPTRAGYRFDGWFTQATDGTKVTSAYSVSEDITVYAHWTALTYNVTFDANGGNSVSTTIVATYDGTYGTLPTPTREGYNFVGWFNGENEVRATDAVKITADTELTAHWTAKEYIIVIDYNGGSGSTAFVKVAYGASIEDAIDGIIPTAAPTGYHFVGWDNADGTASADTTVRAAWAANTYNLTFKDGDAVFGIAQTVTYDGTYEAAFNEVGMPSKTGYTFAGWLNDGVEVRASDIVKITADTELTAHWTANEYIIVIDYNGGSGDKAFLKVRHGDSISEALATVDITAPTGYYFYGWENGEGSASENITSRATWAANTYTVTLDADGGDVEPDSISVWYDSTYAELPTPTREGYTFAGWFDGENEVRLTDTVKITDDITLTAHWTEDEANSED